MTSSKYIVSAKETLIAVDWKKWGKNLLAFTAPLLAGFFTILAQGVPVSKAWPILVLALYGALADLFKKWKSETVYLK